MSSYLSKALANGRRPSKYSKDVEERRLGNALSNYTCGKCSTFDPVFDKEIRELRPDWFKNTVERNKEKLLELAAIPDSKRPSKQREFGTALSSYTSKSQGTYDPVFDKEIRELRPDWFESTAGRKEKLLEIAIIPGSKRPNRRANEKERRLDSALCRYASKNSAYYDSAFDKKIRELRPDWFEDITIKKKKERLLEIATTPGSKRPSNSSKDPEERQLGQALYSYSCRSKSAYDSVFDKEIRKLRPDWFENTADKKKEKLLEIATIPGSKRPNAANNKLGSALCRYTNKKIRASYDPVFDRKIRELRPDWFIKSRMDLKKEKLLELARSGAKRPSSTANDPEKLGSALSSYTSKSQGTYDPVFTRRIRRLRPDWFKHPTANKEKLLELAETGAKRPSNNSKDPEERRLGSALTCYTSKNRKVYDPIFDREIRELRPDWFPGRGRK